jgi:hypothetical protein
MAVDLSGVYLSGDSGTTWDLATYFYNAQIYGWSAVAISADGNTIMTANDNGGIFTSKNFGGTWTACGISNAFGYPVWLSALASSASGDKLFAAVYGSSDNSNHFIPGLIYCSTDSGVTWNPTGSPASNWVALASSSDGSKLIAAAGKSIYTSSNSGTSWLKNDLPFTNWVSGVASSADGSKLAAATGGGGGAGYPGYIYLWQTSSIPVLHISATGATVVVSWTVPSSPFTLQSSSNLATWVDDTNTPFLDFLNLRYEVTVPAIAEKCFYRLRSL